MKLSHAIARGIEMRPKQCFGATHRGNLASCAYGAVLDGIRDLYGDLYGDELELEFSLVRKMHTITEAVFSVNAVAANDVLRIPREAFLQMFVEVGL